MKSKGFAAVAGLLAAVFLGLALWPKQEAMSPMVVAARDLGAGTQLAATDLQVRMVPAATLPPDALTDPEPLLEQTLSVVRFAGETVALNHLGPAIALAPDERGIAVRVRTDSGLAGLLQPGQRVGSGRRRLGLAGPEPARLCQGPDRERTHPLDRPVVPAAPRFVPPGQSRHCTAVGFEGGDHRAGGQHAAGTGPL